MKRNHSFQQITQVPPVFAMDKTFSRQSHIILRNDKMVKESLPQMFLKGLKKFNKRESLGDLVPVEMVEKKILPLIKRKSKIVEPPPFEQ